MNNDRSMTKILTVAAITGTTSAAAVFMGWMLTSSLRTNYNGQWKDVGAMGCLGALLGAHFSTIAKQGTTDNQ